MTQSSIAILVDGATWALLNASPDIRAQLKGASDLRPGSLRGSPVKAAVVSNADVDHIAGLLTLREKTPFTLFATSQVLATLAGTSVFNVLDANLVARCALDLDTVTKVLPALTITPISVPDKVALFLEHGAVALEEIGEQTIGLLITDGARTLAYLPGCAAIPDWLLDRLSGVDMLLFDGTVWENDDMARTGTGEKTGARMGHVPMTGPKGSLARFAALPARKTFVHINNTNPVLQPFSPERATLIAAGWDIAHDGMEITL